jgi:hypothetical protein
LKELREVVDAESDTLVSKLIERIKSKTLKELFSQAMVSEIKIEQRELQQLILKKPEIDDKDKILLKNLSLKKD